MTLDTRDGGCIFPIMTTQRDTNRTRTMTAAEKLDEIRTRRSTRPDPDLGPGDCSAAVLRDLGVDAQPGRSRSMNEIRAELEAAGRRVERLWGTADSRSCPTLAAFIRENPTGTFVLLTGANGDVHSMALRDGRLTDTDLTGGNRRRVNVAYRVTA